MNARRLSDARRLGDFDETITWHAASEQLPEDESTVLVHVPGCGDSVWLGWYDGERWLSVDATEFKEGEVHAWAELPHGPEHAR